MGNRVELRVTGQIQPVLEILALHPVLHLTFPEASLEDAFNSLYREAEDSDRQRMPERDGVHDPALPGFHEDPDTVVTGDPS